MGDHGRRPIRAWGVWLSVLLALALVGSYLSSSPAARESPTARPAMPPEQPPDPQPLGASSPASPAEEGDGCLHVSVRTRDGQPVAGAELTAARLSLESDGYSDTSSSSIATEVGCARLDLGSPPVLTDAGGAVRILLGRDVSLLSARKSGLGVATHRVSSDEKSPTIVLEPDAETEVIVLAETDLTPIVGARLRLTSSLDRPSYEVYTDARGRAWASNNAHGELSAPGFATRWVDIVEGAGPQELLLRAAFALCVDARALGPLASAPEAQVSLVIVAEGGEQGMRFDGARGAWCASLRPTDRYRFSACGPELCAESAWVGPGPPPPVIPWQVEPRVTQGQVIDDERRFDEVLVEVFHGTGRRLVSLDPDGRFRIPRPSAPRMLRVQASRGGLRAEANVGEGPVVLELRAPQRLRGRVRASALCRPPVRLSVESGPVVETSADGAFEAIVPPPSYSYGPSRVSYTFDLQGGPNCPRAQGWCEDPCEIEVEGLELVGTVRRGRGSEPVMISWFGRTLTTQASGSVRVVFPVDTRWGGALDPNGRVVVATAHRRIQPALTRLDEDTWSFGEVSFDAARDVEVRSVDDRGWPLAGTHVACIQAGSSCTNCWKPEGSSCVSRADGRCVLSCAPNTQVVATPLDEGAFEPAEADVAEVASIVLRSPRLGVVRGTCLASPNTLEATRLTLHGPDDVAVASALCGDGTFELRGLAAGEYDLEESPSGRHARVSVVPGTVTTVALVGGARALSSERAGP